MEGVIEISILADVLYMKGKWNEIFQYEFQIFADIA